MLAHRAQGTEENAMHESHHRYVDAAYGPRATDYLASAVHAAGEDLDALEALVGGRARARVLDLGSGAGPVSYRVAPHVAVVTAVDVSQPMLDLVARTARERGLANVTTRSSAAESLPFDSGRFDLVLSRFSAHHWRDLDAGLREAQRVLAPGGRAVLIDSIAPSAALLDSHLQTIELLRDPTHVRNYTAAEWTAALARARFETVALTARRLRIEFDSWIVRTRTSRLHAEAIRSFQAAVPDEVRARFGLEADGSFLLDALQIEARKE
jgi:ubiquinone/menaquinone biosynthesis C-methylase UbiE